MAFPVNIDDIINRKTVESSRVEFKRGWNPLKIIKTVCAFANDIDELGGGYLIIGIEVDETTGEPILPPYGVEQKELDKIQREFFKLCQDDLKPNIFPQIYPVEFQGKWIVMIMVTTGDERPYYAPERLGRGSPMCIYVRHGAITKETDNSQEKLVRELAEFNHYDDKINRFSTLQDLDLGLILSYLREIKSQLYEEATKLSFEDICLKMEIARGPKENIKPLNLGLLLFCPYPEKFFQGCITNLIEFEDESGIAYQDKQFKGPVHIQIRQIMDYLKLNIIKKYNKKFNLSAESTTFYNYPYQALEEVVVNSLYHRSYEEKEPNEIRIFKYGTDRRIEVLSYPGPLPPVDEQALLQYNVTARKYRNSKLGDRLKTLRLAEKCATGIPTILRSLESNGSQKPLLAMDEARSYFMVVLKAHLDTPHENQILDQNFHHVTLSDMQQSILEKLTIEPTTKEDLISSFDIDILSDIDYIISKKLVSVKKIKDIEIVFINEQGRVALKESF